MAKGWNSALTSERLLSFGENLAGYGEAVLNQSEGGHVSFTPTHVGPSIQNLNAKMRTISLILLVVGGGMIVFSGTPLVEVHLPAANA